MEQEQDFVVDFLPTPLDVPPVEGVRPKDGEVVSRKPSDDESSDDDVSIVL